jgi:hypothetical protein
MNARSCFADAETARRALALCLPMIEPLVADRSLCGSGFLCIVVMDPALTPRTATFDDAVLLEHAVGDRAKWDADYAAFARAKAKASWLHGLDGTTLQCSHAHALREGESLLAGAVCLDGIVVAASGAFEWADEAVALCVAACLRALAKQRREQAREAGMTSAA